MTAHQVQDCAWQVGKPVSGVGQAKEKLVGHIIREVSDTDDGGPGRHCCILAFTLNYMENHQSVLNTGVKIIRL